MNTLEKRYNMLLNKLKILNEIDEKNLSKDEKNKLSLQKREIVDELDILKKKLNI